jgi:hypothetical protein
MRSSACILARYTGSSSRSAASVEHFPPVCAMISNHVPEEWLNEYSRGTLEASKLAQVEEHLLICEQCCERLTRLDDAWGLNG